MREDEGGVVCSRGKGTGIRGVMKKKVSVLGGLLGRGAWGWVGRGRDVRVVEEREINNE